jgi:hypothetical protein
MGIPILLMAASPICLLSSFYLHRHQGTNDGVPLIDEIIQSDCLIRFFNFLMLGSGGKKYIEFLAVNKDQGVKRDEFYHVNSFMANTNDQCYASWA